VAEAYLRGRAIDPPYPAALRFAALPYGKIGAMPCLICAVRDLAGEVTGIQRIWLADDGRGKAAVPKPKLSLGRVRGGAIRLGELDGSGAVTVCEGPEDGLSLAAMLGGPVWVAAGASFLPAMQFPPAVRSVLIGADNDPSGRAAADKGAAAFAARGLAVRILRPLAGCKDFNDELREARP
jgi:DNA primase